MTEEKTYKQMQTSFTAQFYNYIVPKLKKYEYELDKDGNATSVYPDANNHSIDAVRYGLEQVWKRKGK